MREQRCRVHTKNLLNALPKPMRLWAKEHLQDIRQAGTRADAEEAFALLLETYGMN